MRKIIERNQTELDDRDIISIIDRYQEVRSAREARWSKRPGGKGTFFIQQWPAGDVWLDAQTPEASFAVNMRYIADSLEVPSDHLPVLEPWFGTGVYANIYGCPYLWRKGEAPAVHYRWHSLEELRGWRRPRWEDSEIARLVLDTIRYFKSRTGDAIPIVWTDTQSPSDTATLIVDASSVFAGCLLEPELVFSFMREISDIMIEFSRVQAELIGDALLQPGHIMFSRPGQSGIMISDDNLAVGSPYINERFNLPLSERIGQAFGGVAIHSCGTWTHTMPMLKKLVPSCDQIDCAIDITEDPTPNEPEAVRDALAGTGVIVKARMRGDTQPMLEIVKRLLHPELTLVVQPAYIDAATAERNYAALEALLSEYYGTPAGS